MTPALGWLLTLVGAALFVGVGYLFARLAAAPEGAEIGREDLSGEVARLKRELAAAQQAGGGSTPGVTKELESLRARVKTAEKRESELSGQVKTAEKQRDASSSQVKQLEANLLSVKQQHEKAVRQLASLEASLAEQDAEPTQVTTSAAASAVAEIERLKAETAASQKQLAAQAKQLEAAKTAAKAAEARASESEKRAKAAGRTVGPAAGMQAPGADALAALKAADEAKKQLAPVAERAKKAEAELKGIREQLAAAQKVADTQRKELADYRRQIDAAEQKPSTKVGVNDPQQALRNANADLKVVRAELERARKQVDELRAELSGRGSGEDSDSLKTVPDSRGGVLAAAEEKLAHLDRLEKEVFELKDKNQALNAQLNSLKAFESENETLRTDRIVLERKGKEAEQLRARESELASQLQSKEMDRKLLQSKVEELQQAQDDRTDLALKVNVLQEQLRELDQVRDENLNLRSQWDELNSLKNQLEALRSENDNLRSLQLVQSKPPKLVELPADGGEEGMGQMLQRIVNELADKQNAQCAVLADELGLVVAGFGDHIEAMAAMSALFGELTGRVKGVLPLGTLAQLALVDSNSLAFVAQPLSAGDNDLMLAMLAPGGAPDPQAVGKVLAGVTKQVTARRS